MTENNKSRMWTIARMAVRCVKLALGLAFAGLMGVVIIITLVHLYEAHPKLYALAFSLVLLSAFVYMTVGLAGRDDNGKEDLA